MHFVIAETVNTPLWVSFVSPTIALFGIPIAATLTWVFQDKLRKEQQLREDKIRVEQQERDDRLRRAKEELDEKIRIRDLRFSTCEKLIAAHQVVIPLAGKGTPESEVKAALAVVLQTASGVRLTCSKEMGDLAMAVWGHLLSYCDEQTPENTKNSAESFFDFVRVSQVYLGYSDTQ